MTPSVKLPTFLCGRYADVRRACRKAAARLMKGASPSDLPEEWIDVAELPGYIVVEGPDPYRADEPHYHGYALVAWLIDHVSARDPLWIRFFEDMLVRPWLIYSCMGADSYFLFRGVEPARRFVTAIRDQWDVLASPGSRFLLGVEPEGFGTAARTMWTSLGKLGATELQARQLETQLRSGGRPPLLDLYADGHADPDRGDGSPS